jgi:hypothetical protein
MASDKKALLLRVYWLAMERFEAKKPPFAGMTPQDVKEASSPSPAVCTSRRSWTDLMDLQMEAADEGTFILEAASANELSLAQMEAFCRSSNSAERPVKKARKELEARIDSLEQRHSKLSSKMDPFYHSLAYFLPEEEWSTVPEKFASVKADVIEGLQSEGYSEVSATQLWNEDGHSCTEDFVRKLKEDEFNLFSLWKDLKDYLVSELPNRQ